MTRDDFSVNGHWDVTVFTGADTPGLNQGFAWSDTDKRRSVVVIGKATSYGQFVNTAVHEAKHVQSVICEHYGVPGNSEEAAYLMGYLAMKILGKY